MKQDGRNKGLARGVALLMHKPLRAAVRRGSKRPKA